MKKLSKKQRSEFEQFTAFYFDTYSSFNFCKSIEKALDYFGVSSVPCKCVLGSQTFLNALQSLAVGSSLVEFGKVSPLLPTSEYSLGSHLRISEFCAFLDSRTNSDFVYFFIPSSYKRSDNSFPLFSDVLLDLIYTPWSSHSAVSKQAFRVSLGYVPVCDIIGVRFTDFVQVLPLLFSYYMSFCRSSDDWASAVMYRERVMHAVVRGSMYNECVFDRSSSSAVAFRYYRRFENGLPYYYAYFWCLSRRPCNDIQKQLEFS